MARANAGIIGDRADPVWLVLPLLGWLSLAGAAEGGQPPVARELPPLSVRGMNYYPHETPWGGMCTSRDPAFGAEESLRAKIGAAPGTEDDQARLYEIVLSAAQEARVAGAIAWCLHDYPIQDPNESHFGVIRADGSLKPAARVLRSFFERWRARE